MKLIKGIFLLALTAFLTYSFSIYLNKTYVQRFNAKKGIAQLSFIDTFYGNTSARTRGLMKNNNASQDLTLSPQSISSIAREKLVSHKKAQAFIYLGVFLLLAFYTYHEIRKFALPDNRNYFYTNTNFFNRDDFNLEAENDNEVDILMQNKSDRGPEQFPRI